MQIVIPTRGRVGRQATLRWLPPSYYGRTSIVCPKSEAWRHKSTVPEGVAILEQPDEDMWIGEKRAWIMRKWGHELSCKKLLMLDDDLGFFARPVPEEKQLRSIANIPDGYKLVEQALYEMEQLLCDTLPHAALGQKQGNNNCEPGWSKTSGRTMFALGYYLPTVLNEAQLGRVQHREDLDVALQLLARGLSNTINNTVVVSPGSYNQPGGCSEQRTVDSSDADAVRLAELHPGYVRVVKKEYEGSPARLEVVCSWAKALKDGQQRRFAGA